LKKIVVFKRGGTNMNEQEEREKEKINEELILQALKEENIDLFREEFTELHPYDQAKVFNTFLLKRWQVYLKTSRLKKTNMKSCYLK
jgi:hypothetical protein